MIDRDMLNNHLIIFARQPRMGRVKTRLAKDIGRVAAWNFYRHILSRTVSTLTKNRRWKTVLALTPDRAIHQHPPWRTGLMTPRIPFIAQGSGDLGCRMQRIFRNLPPGPVIIIGADIPDIRACYIDRAFKILGHKRCVFGPADDGGYWLVGCNRRPRLPELFKNVRWSTEFALKDTLDPLPPSVTVGFAKQLSDIDTGGDLKKRN